jgi:hypothetical protein
VKIKGFVRRFTPVNVLFMGLSLFLLLSAFRQLQTTIAFADLFYLNTAMTAADSTNKAMIDRYAAQAEAVVATNQCRSDIVDAGLTFVLTDLDLQNSIDQYDSWAAAMVRADRYIVHALSCNPGDGDLWARLAMVRQASSENAGQLSALLNQSSLLAPSEMYVVRARFFVWRRASAATLALSSDAVERDVRTVLTYSYWQVAADILANPGANLKPHILAAARLISQDRLDALKSHGVDLAAL